MAIPRIIHYCWFGSKPMPSYVKKYVESWKKYLPDYEIMCWSEKNFDITTPEYVRDAYNAKKYAFVSDYARLYALKVYSGIYFDIDIQVLRHFDELLKYNGIFCFESQEKLMTAFMAASKDNPVIDEFLKYYIDQKFDINHLEPNTVPLTNLLKNRGLKINDSNQLLDGDIIVFSNEYFNAYDFSRATFKITENTYTIHHCLGSWCSAKEKLIFKSKYLLSHILSEKAYEKLKGLKKKVIGV